MTERPTARQIVRDDAQAFGWRLTPQTFVDQYERGGDILVVMWSAADPENCCHGSTFFPATGGDIRNTSPMCIVRAREWLRADVDGDLLAPAPTREN